MSLNSEVLQWKYENFLVNKNNNFNKKEILEVLSSEEIDLAYETISNWKNYSPTPLILLNKLNKKLKLNKIFYKDESKRFHLKSFKALGGAYAVEKVAKGNPEYFVLRNAERINRLVSLLLLWDGAVDQRIQT